MNARRLTEAPENEARCPLCAGDPMTQGQTLPAAHCHRRHRPKPG